MNFSASVASCSSLSIHPSPDFRGGTDFRQGEAEGFDHHPAVVARLRGACRKFPSRQRALAPGVLRSFSEMWTWTVYGAAVRIASAMSFSSMLAWNVSYIIRQLGMIHLGDEPGRVGGAGEEVRLEAVEVFDGQHHARLLRVLGDLRACCRRPTSTRRSSAQRR